MHQKVRLFIGGRELEFNKEPSILYQFSMDDIQNPTAVRNSYTKTIQVEGTQRNNQIFNDIWDLTRTQATGGDVEGYFNPSKRTDFELYIDGDLYETGYVKLDAINRKGNAVTYSITLYGGVGDFLYSLTYSPMGEKLRLSDLNFLVLGDSSGNPETELDFNITWNAVSGAWAKLAGWGNYPLWDVINFMPCYNGYPDAIDADKVLFNTSGFTTEVRMRQNNTTTTIQGLPSSITEDNKTYTIVNGYGFGEINGKMTEWETRDLRSYLQRPVLRVKKVIEACCDPTQNGGYEVELDTDFFNSGNTYYEDAWITLPLLTDMEYEDERTDPWSVSVGLTTTLNGQYNTIYTLREDSVRGQGTTALQVSFTPQLKVRDYAYPRGDSTDNILYTSAYISGSDSRVDYASYVYQLVGFDSQGNVVCGSDIYNLTSDVNGSYLNLTQTLYQTPYPNASIQNRLGYFSKVSAGTYEWGEEIVLKMTTNNSKVATVKLYATMLANITQVRANVSGQMVNTYGSRQGKLYSSTSMTESQYSARTRTASWIKPEMDGEVTYGTGSKINSGAKVTKKVLLNLDGTPCDYLLGYLKTFGLYLHKDPLRKKVQILTRGKFYNSTPVQDWEDRVDHSRGVKITPLTFKHKWYSFNYDQGDKSMFETNYYTKWGTDYGVQKVNTGYNFDSETDDLLKGIVYKNAAEGVEKSPYFYNRVVNGSTDTPTELFSWVKYTLMNGDDTASVDVGSSLNFSDISLGIYGDMYDAFPKVQFRDQKKEPIDGSGVFVFFNGMVPMTDSQGNNIDYTLSDDRPEMITYNGNPCWFWSKSIFDKSGNQVCDIIHSLPSFGRYKYTEINGANIINSWDFGKTKELFVPYVYYNENANVYDRFWSRYVNDLFDVNTRIAETFVRLPKTQGDKLLRQFYWFDDALWRINKIVDWNVCSGDLTKVEFVKVQEITNYTTYVDPVVPTAETFEWNITMSPESVPGSGGTVTFTVNANQSWGSLGTNVDWITFSDGNHCPSGTTVFTGTAEENPNGYTREFTMYVWGAYDDRRNATFVQDGGEGIIVNIFCGTTETTTGTTVGVRVWDEYAWTATTPYSYVSFPNGNTGNGDKVNGEDLIVFIDPYYAPPPYRFGTIVITDSSGRVYTLYLTQEGLT